MAAMTSGGEAQPKFPEFNKVMMITGEIKEPKRVLPVFGFDGQELCESEMGVRLCYEEDITQDSLSVGAPLVPQFNWLASGKQHLEGGRYIVNKSNRKRSNETELVVGKRIRQRIDRLTSDDSSDDETYVPASNWK